MTRLRFALLSLATLVALLSACASYDPKPEFEDWRTRPEDGPAMDPADWAIKVAEMQADYDARMAAEAAELEAAK